MIRYAWAGLFALALAAAGCGEPPTDYSGVKLIKVTGKVTLDGRPLANATVQFAGTDGHTSVGKTNAEGVYQLMYDSEMPGVTEGPKVVRIMTGAATEEGADPSGKGEGGAPPAEPIPARYNRQSQLKAEVTSTSTTFDFPLASKA